MRFAYNLTRRKWFGDVVELPEKKFIWRIVSDGVVNVVLYSEKQTKTKIDSERSLKKFVEDAKFKFFTPIGF